VQNLGITVSMLIFSNIAAVILSAGMPAGGLEDNIGTEWEGEQYIQ